MSEVAEKPRSLVAEIAESMQSTRVFVFCKRGTMPLEWPRLEGGGRTVDDEDTTVLPNGKVLRTNRRAFRNIDTRAVNEQGVGAQSQGFMVLDLADKTEKDGETDAEFLERIEDWIENSGDYRIDKYGVRVERGNPFPIPFSTWDDLTDEAALSSIANMLVDDVERNEEILSSAIKYELNRHVKRDDGRIDGPRERVLAGLDYLAAASGDESDDESPEDES